MIWKTEVEVTLASLQVERRYECLLRKKRLSRDYHTLPFSDLSRPSFERQLHSLMQLQPKKYA